MYKAIGSKLTINEQSNHAVSSEYYEMVKDIIEAPEVAALDNYYQHLNTSRLQHCVNVSYYSFRAAKLFRLNGRAAARAGLLHDMYYYEYCDTALSCSEHSKLHSEQALQNAKGITGIDSMEEDIILSHMWPMTKKAPSSLEGYVVTLMDKGCTFFELLSKIPNLLMLRKHAKAAE